MKKCTRCGEYKPTTEFNKRAASPDGLEYKCRSCASEYYATYSKKDGKSERDRDTYLIRTYGITTERYEELLEQQDRACALCRKSASEFKRRLAVDHDHTCCPTVAKSCGECIRGLLCPACNTFLGKIESGAVTLEQVEEYRNKNRPVTYVANLQDNTTTPIIAV